MISILILLLFLMMMTFICFPMLWVGDFESCWLVSVRSPVVSELAHKKKHVSLPKSIWHHFIHQYQLSKNILSDLCSFAVCVYFPWYLSTLLLSSYCLSAMGDHICTFLLRKPSLRSVYEFSRILSSYKEYASFRNRPFKSFNYTFVLLSFFSVSLCH